jgi:hypothetical protein
MGTCRGDADRGDRAALSLTPASLTRPGWIWSFARNRKHLKTIGREPPGPSDLTRSRETPHAGPLDEGLRVHVPKLLALLLSGQEPTRTSECRPRWAASSRFIASSTAPASSSARIAAKIGAPARATSQERLRMTFAIRRARNRRRTWEPARSRQIASRRSRSRPSTSHLLPSAITMSPIRAPRGPRGIESPRAPDIARRSMVIGGLGGWG